MKKILWLSAAALLALFVVAAMLQAQGDSSATITHFNTSINLEAKGKKAEALSEMEKISESSSSDYLISLRLGWLSYLNKQYSQSKSYYRKAVQASHGHSVEALLGLTLPLAAEEKWDDVISAYQDILTGDAANYTANLRLGQIFLNRADYSKAATYLDAVLKRYPGDYEANLYSGWNNYYLGRKDDARQAFEYALMTSPGDTSATRGYALVK